MVAWSGAAHVLLLGLAVVAPSPGSVAPARVIDVELLGLPDLAPAPPAPAPPAAEPEPPRAEPAPPPPPPPPEPETVVLPEQPTALPKPEPEPKPKPKPEPREVFREPEKKTEKSLDEILAEARQQEQSSKDYEQVMADLRSQETGSEEAPPDAPPGGGGAPSTLSAEERAWHRDVRRHMKGIWILPSGFRTQVLETTVSLRLDAAGNILGEPEVVRRSGNPWYDDSVLRGLAKASPLPRPPRAGEFQLVFRPEDSL